MFSKVCSMAIFGLQVLPVSVEADIAEGGLPVFDMVGYLGSEVKESRERIRTAMRNSGYLLPPKRITVNLSPADQRKSGSSYDLAVAVSLLSAMGLIPPDCFEDTVVSGELSLSGEIRGVAGILPMVLTARDMGCRRFLCSRENVREGAQVEGIRVVGVSTLNEAVACLSDPFWMEAPESGEGVLPDTKAGPEVWEQDFSDVRGQAAARRALEISASGLHNILLVGPPGSGKSMMAKCLPSILPPLNREECMEISKIYSVAGLLGPEGLVKSRPFVAPHHTITTHAMAGGGKIPRPGMVSLAHRGVLFLDELPEFHRETLEILRQPMEDRQIRIARARATFTYPADFLLAAAMNPCRCGYYPDRRRCSCSEIEVKAYLSRISGPLLDRMDLAAETSEIGFSDLMDKGGGGAAGESSAAIRARVLDAAEIQKKRYEGTSCHFNRDLGVRELKRYCALGVKEERLMEEASGKLGLSARACHRILKCARTIADLDHSDRIRSGHLAEAVGYRGIDRRYWDRSGPERRR